MVFNSGQEVGPYRLVNKLGSGGFGEVWLAERVTSITRIFVALKLPFHMDLDLLREEAEMWVHASGHPNIVPVWDTDIDRNGQVYIASEYVNGGTLYDWLNSQGGKAPSLDLAARIMSDILKGLEHLHSLKPEPLVHRDLKLSNIMMQEGVPRLTDFGIARTLHATNGMTIHIEGTPQYMAPEAFSGLYSVATDIWAAGVVFYRLCTGTMPFAKSDLVSLMEAITRGQPQKLALDMPTALVKLFDTVFQKDPDKRFPSACAMRKAIEKLWQPSSVETSNTIARPDSLPVAQPSSVSSPFPPFPEFPPSSSVSSSPLFPLSLPSPIDIPLDIPSEPVDDDGFVFIPAGEFLMGDGSDRKSGLQRIYLDSYCISKYPVTVKKYFEFIEETGHRKPTSPPWGWKSDHPMVNVSWYDAMAYCAWASTYMEKMMTLPTEAQWEKACRGIDGRKYPWGDEWDVHRLQCSRRHVGDARSTSSIEAYPAGASPYGVMDMSGNVWEWCLGWYFPDRIRHLSSSHRVVPGSEPSRARRGCSWDFTDPLLFRASYRSGNRPVKVSINMGFRVVQAFPGI